LAGRSGLYLDTLTAALQHDRLAPPVQPDGRWPTFAGSATRTQVVPTPIDVGSLLWRVPLTPVTPGTPRYRNPNFMVQGPVPPDRLLAYHPIVLGDQVVICDEDHIIAYNLNDRPSDPEDDHRNEVSEAWKHDEQQGGNGSPRASRGFGSLPRFTLTAYGDRIF